MIVVRSDGVELRPESPLVTAPPTVPFCWLSVERSWGLDLSIAAFLLMKMQLKIIDMVAELRLSIILVLREILIHSGRPSPHSRSEELCQSLTVEALHAAHCIAAISLSQLRESF